MLSEQGGQGPIVRKNLKFSQSEGNVKAVLVSIYNVI